MTGEDISDLAAPVAAPPSAAPVADAPQPAPTLAMTPAELSTHVKALYGAGAQADSIRAYILQHGYKLPQGLDEAVAYRDKTGRNDVNIIVDGQAANTGTPPPAPITAEDISDLSQPVATAAPVPTIGRELGLGARATLQGIGSAIDFPTQILESPINAALDALGVPNYDTSAAKAASRIADAVGAPTPATNDERMASAGVSGAASVLPTLAMGVGAAAPITQLVSGAGSGVGSEAVRQGGGGAAAQMAAGLGGALLGGGGAAALANRVESAAAPLVASPTAQAFQRLDIPALPADVGGVGTRMATSAIKMTLGGIPIAEAAQNTVNAARAARNAIAARIGPVEDNLGAGNAAQAGARSFIAHSADKGGRLYDAIPIAANTPASLGNTKRALDGLTAGLQSNPELSAMLSDKRLSGYAAAITGSTKNVPTGLLDADGAAMTRPVQQGGALSWDDLKRFRTFIGEQAGAPALQSDTSQKALKSLYGALSEDMQATAAAQGPQAKTAFQRANEYWRERQETIDNALAPLLGKNLDKSGDAAFRQIESWSGSTGDVTKLAIALRSMPADEAATVRATLFNRLGDASAGAQNGAGNVFSPAQFVTHWNRLSMHAKAALFPGADYRQSIDDLVTAADAMKAAQKYNNTPHTGLAINLVGHIGSMFASPLATLATAAGEFGAGKLLASPRFAQWLASSRTRPNAPAQLAHIRRLSSIAAAEPAIASGVLNLQEKLASAFANDNSAAVVAADPAQDKKQSR